MAQNDYNEQLVLSALSHGQESIYALRRLLKIDKFDLAETLADLYNRGIVDMIPGDTSKRNQPQSWFIK